MKRKFDLLFEEIKTKLIKEEFQTIAQSEYNGYKILLYDIDDQGDTNYGFRIINLETNEELYDSVEIKEFGWYTLNEAMDEAKRKIDSIKSGIEYQVKSQLKCPWCGNKLNDVGKTFFMNCFKCGLVPKSKIKNN